MAARGEDLRRIGDFEALCRYLEDTLGWPLGEGEYDFDALTFEYTPEELGLLDQYADAIESIHQLRPVVDGQPWGIFFVRFRRKKLPVGVLRRILSQLALKKRASANKAERAAWMVDDLLFVSAFGDETRNREIAFAHFHQHGGDLPTLRVVGWDGDDTPLKLEYLQGVLADKLRWPSDPADAEAWRKLWRSPFRHRPGHIIRKSDELAQELAKLARAIRDRAQAVMKAESAKGPLTKLHDAFKKALIHDLTKEGFADTYAQTITYGLLTAAISRTEMSEGRRGTALLATDLAEMVPVTNPFLKEMLQTFLEAGGRKGGIDFDELGVQDVVELLRGEDTDLPAILRDFGNRTQGEDPVIHFYEHFLKAYNKELKIQRGVFYTPQPVVSYIVRSVHELLQTEFGLADGLADTTTWGEMLQKHPKMKLPLLSDSLGETQTISPDEPFVQILDPATGTATFLVEVVDVIYRAMTEKWKKQGLTEVKRSEAWNEYVPAHLLPRLHAFELMMAPYAIAHMKIGLKLAETGYQFGTEGRVRVYLTNALEPWVRQLPMIGFDALAHEASAVNEIKQLKRFTVIVGNPPYSKMSGNLGPDAVALVEPFRHLDGVRIVEKGALAFEVNLQDDYVKFWGFLSKELIAAGVGIGSFITNSRYLGSPSLRGLRGHIHDNFSKAFFLDLGGQISERKAIAVNDENVFDIEQGVAIGAVIRALDNGRDRSVRSDRLTGSRSEKYAALTVSTVSRILKEVEMASPYYRFNRSEAAADEEFGAWSALDEIMPFNSGSIITSRDNLAIDFDRTALLSKIDRFATSRSGDRRIEEEIGYSVKAKWDVERCKKEIRSIRKPLEYVRKVLYRPFDVREIFYLPSLLDTPSRPVSESIYSQENLVLLSPGVKTSNEFTHAFVSKIPAEKKACSHDRATQMFPLYSGVSDLLSSKQINIVSDVFGGLEGPDAFNYMYSILYSPNYRERYGAALRDSFPRIPVAIDDNLARGLSVLGGELVALHLLESPLLDKLITEFIGGRNVKIEKISWSDNTVWVDKAQTTGFRGVHEDVWKFHIGGYQVCEKWLKDRKGRTLSNDDIAHYHKIVVALFETIRLMVEIDRVIDQHGGWPGAFSAPPSGIAVAEPANEPLADEATPASVTARAVGRGMPLDLFQSVPVRRVADDSGSARIEPQDTNELVAEVRSLFAEGDSYRRDQAIDELRGKLAYKLPEEEFRQRLDDILKTCVRRGILDNDAGMLSLRYRSLAEHAQDDRDGLKTQFLASLNGRAWTERDEAIAAFARWMGFRRTGARIREIAESLVKGLLREGRLARDGSRIRRS